jgi:murein DD-endopeptidase MepM/ murein hydrolase activator NlpD
MFSTGFAVGALSVALLLLFAGAHRPDRMSSDAERDESSEADVSGPGEISPPIAALRVEDIHDTFNEGRSSGRAHEAADIMSPRGTPVLAVTAGTIRKLFTSRAGGLTVYQFDSAADYCYYYAHLDRYAEGLTEGMAVKRGDRIGYVGSTGNADPAAPHLHFAIFRLGPEKQWWKGTPIDPYPFLIRAVKKDTSAGSR